MNLRRSTRPRAIVADIRRLRAVLSLVLLSFAVIFGRTIFFGRLASVSGHVAVERPIAVNEAQSRCTRARSIFHHARHGSVASFRNDDDDDDDDDSDDVIVPTNYWEELAHPQLLVPSIATSLATGFATPTRVRDRIAPAIPLRAHEARGPPHGFRAVA